MRLILLTLLLACQSLNVMAGNAAGTYMGRPLADVMAPGGMDWLERENRESEERLSQLIKALPLKPGLAVADIGAGSGVIARLMAPKILPAGTVYAVDIQQAMLDRMQVQNSRLAIKNIKPVLGGIKDPKLPQGSIDLVLMVDVYHEFSEPLAMLQSISKALKKGGMIALVEYRAEDPGVPIKAEHKMSLEQIRQEFGLKELGLELLRIDSSLPRQHLVFFIKRRA